MTSKEQEQELREHQEGRNALEHGLHNTLNTPQSIVSLGESTELCAYPSPHDGTSVYYYCLTASKPI